MLSVLRSLGRADAAPRCCCFIFPPMHFSRYPLKKKRETLFVVLYYYWLSLLSSMCCYFWLRMASYFLEAFFTLSLELCRNYNYQRSTDSFGFFLFFFLFFFFLLLLSFFFLLFSSFLLIFRLNLVVSFCENIGIYRSAPRIYFYLFLFLFGIADYDK